MRPNVSRTSSRVPFRKPLAPRLSLLAALIAALAWPAWAQNSGGHVEQDGSDYIYVGNASSGSIVTMTSTQDKDSGGNTVDLTHVYGGRSNSGQWVVDNSVVVDRANFPGKTFILPGNLFGGSTNSGHAAENQVFMNTGLVGGSVYGNHTEEGNVLGDGTANVTLTGLAAVVDNVYGGWMSGRLGSSDNNQRIARQNYVRLERQAGVGVTRGTNNDGGNVYGGYSANQYKDATADAVTNNTVVLAENAQVSKGSNTSPNGHVFGGWAAKGNVAYNKVRIEGGGTPGTGGVLVEGDVTANHAADGSATGSNDLDQPDVYIEAGKVDGDVIGGNSRSTAPVTGHVVKIAGGEIGGNIYGGLGNGGSIQDNTIVLAGEADLDGSILYGHFGGSATGSQNNTLRVEVKGEQVQAVHNFDTWHFALPDDLDGDSDPTQAEIMLKVTNQGSALAIDGDRVTVSTDGGNLALLGLNERAVLLSLNSGSFNYTTSLPGAAQTARLDGEPKGLPALVYAFDDHIANQLGIWLYEKFLYGSGGTNTLGQREQGNTLTLTSGNATAAFGGRSNKVNAVVSGNTAKMSGGELVRASGNSLSGNLYGGYADEGSATGNTVNFSGGKAYEVTGGEGIKGSATDNTVTISGSAEVMGTYVRGGAGGFGDATGNTVTLAGGSFSAAEVYGGFVRPGSGFAATGNTVILGANLGKDALQNAQIYGGNTPARVTGNTLSVEGAGLTVGSINNFENLHFILPAATAAGATMLKVTGGAATRFVAAMTNIGVAIAGGGSVLKMGDTVTLLTNAAGLENSSGTDLVQGTDYQQVNLTGRQGISLDYGFALDNDANSIFAQVTAVPKPKPTPQPQPDPKPQPTPPQPEPPQPTPPGPQVNPQTKAIPEGRVAGMGMLNLGADQIVRMTGNLPNRTGGGGVFDRSGGPLGAGGGNANGAGAPSDTTAFAQLSGYDQKAETGSHVKVNGASAIVGAAKVVPLAGGGTAAVGAFFEYGDGSFKTHNGFDTGDVNGKGNSDYYGAGVLARVNLAGKDNGAPFVEGSVHAGRIHNNWHTDDLRDAATGARAQYDIRTPYMGGHVGAGYRWQANDTTQVEVFGQYLYTHMDGKETTVALDPYSFRAVKSSRTRIGAKGTWAVSERSQAYAGAAWEREFDGTARATAYSFDVPAPTMKGNSAVLDAGLTFQPKRNLTTNVGVTGYAGKRKGAAANVEVQYLF